MFMIWKVVSSNRKCSSCRKWVWQSLYFKNKFKRCLFFSRTSISLFCTYTQNMKCKFFIQKISEFSKLITFVRGFIQFLLCIEVVQHTRPKNSHKVAIIVYQVPGEQSITEDYRGLPARPVVEQGGKKSFWSPHPWIAPHSTS